MSNQRKNRMDSKTKTRAKLNGYAKWISIAIVLAVITYNAISNIAMKHNDLRHILETQNELLERIERIEDYLWIK